MKIDKYFFSATCLMAVLLLTFSACTQDELAEQAGILPEGKYPLQIGSVSITADVDQQPWSAGAPQTRVSENPDDGNSSHWDNGDKIKVQIGNGTPGTYTYQDGSQIIAEGDAPAYWASKADGQSILAWHTSSGSKTVELDNQTKTLAYLLTAQAAANFNEPVSLNFGHALAKVRVKLEGEKAADAKSVEIKTYTSCTLDEYGTLKTVGTEDFIPMVKATYNGETFWEANVMPGCEITEIKVNGYKSTLSTALISQVAKINTITLDTKPIIPEDAREITGEISDDGNYLVTGNYTKRITITAGSPNIYLKDANINVEDIRNDNAIHITGGSPTIHVLGENNVSVLYGAGIFVAEEHTVTIVGYKREDKLTARGGEGGSGIGAYAYANAGNIHISNVTIEAHASYSVDCNLSAGIGGSYDHSCGTITIEDATVHAYGIQRNGIITPGIGSGYPKPRWGNPPPSIPVVTISNSEIHTHRSSDGNGGSADYIGWGSDNYYPNNTPANSTINLGVGGMCTGSTIYCYTGDTLDKTVTYDANGNEMVQ